MKKLILIAALVVLLSSVLGGWKWGGKSHAAAPAEQLAGWAWGGDDGPGLRTTSDRLI